MELSPAPAAGMALRVLGAVSLLRLASCLNLPQDRGLLSVSGRESRAGGVVGACGLGFCVPDTALQLGLSIVL